MSIDEQALADCDAEPIHIPGVVQGNGVLLGLDRATFGVDYASENASDFLDLDAKDVLGATAESIFGRELTHLLRNALQVPDVAARRQPVGCMEGRDQALSVFAFASGDHLVVELEPIGAVAWSDTELASRIAELFQVVNRQSTVEDLLRCSVRWLEMLTGYDRVMIYRFKDDWSGEVVAERNGSEHEDFLGLSFPRWDIPTQAREIMQRVPLRMITDAGAEPIPILAASAALPPLDIAIAHLRGVSPVHLQYLHNMRVRASMTLSILTEEKLWGIVSFHHYETKIPSPRVRAIVLPFIEYFNIKLTQLAQAEAATSRERARSILDHIRRNHGEGAELASLVTGDPMPLLDQFNAQGMVVCIGGEWQSFGRVVPAYVIEPLIEEARASKRVAAVDRISGTLMDPRWHEEKLAGALAISLGSDDVVVIFREEIEATVRWAGNPEKDIHHDGERYRLSPRGSFSLFLETISHRAEPWRAIDFELAEGLATLFLQSEQSRRRMERKFFEDRDRQQRLMINELNHRVRNILALIRSVSRQARGSNASLSSYSAALEHRIKALAVAHNLSNDTTLSSVSLSEIIAKELAPYAEEGARRFSLEGADRRIRPDLCPIFALAVHELSTNAAKYGALSSPDGVIVIALRSESEGLVVRWQETGGPDVRAPDENGFGTLLIGNAIPFELDGRVDIDFRPDGLVVEIWLPDEVLNSAASEKAPAAYVTQFPAARPLELPLAQGLGMALLVEDNFAIALDAEDMLREIGFADVITASSVRSAQALMNRHDFQVGVLDMHLGSETSFDVARELLARNIPFLFSTGYGSDVDRPPEFERVPLLTKPVDVGALAAELAKLVAGDPIRRSA